MTIDRFTISLSIAANNILSPVTPPQPQRKRGKEIVGEVSFLFLFCGRGALP